MSNTLQTARPITGMKKGGAKPQQPMISGGNTSMKAATKFLDTHKKANAPKMR